jgi:nucleotide-binding universal stress UspA family protein
MKIVIGIDDSPHSQAALQWVRKMPWPADTRIVLVSAAEVAAYLFVDPAGASVYDQIHREQLAACEQLIAKARGELAPSGLPVNGHVEHGDAREVIVRTAEVERADLVVVGSHGRTGLPKLMMGSVASHVVTHAPCTVVVVKTSREPGIRTCV